MLFQLYLQNVWLRHPPSLYTSELCHDATDCAFFRCRSRRSDVDVRTKRGRKVYDVRVNNFDGAQMPSIPYAQAWRRRGSRRKAHQPRARHRVGRRRQEPRVQIVIDRFQMTEKSFIKLSARGRRKVAHRFAQIARRRQLTCVTSRSALHCRSRVELQSN